MLSMYFVTLEIFRLNLHVFRIYGQVIMAISPLYYSFYRCITLTLFFQIEFDSPGLLKQLALGDLCYQKYLWNKNFNCLYAVYYIVLFYRIWNNQQNVDACPWKFSVYREFKSITYTWILIFWETNACIPMCKWENIQPHSPHPKKKISPKEPPEINSF